MLMSVGHVILAILFILSSGVLFNERFRKNTIVVLVAGAISSISVLYFLYDRFEAYIPHRIEVGQKRGLGPPMEACIVGESVRPTASTFLLDFLVVEDGPAVQAIVSKSPEANHGAELLRAITSDEVKRFSGAGQLSVGILGIASQGFPSQVPYLQGSNTCQGMAATRVDDGVLKFLVPVQGAQYQGQSSIVLPRMVLSAAHRPHVCVEADFPLYRRGMIEGPYAERKNVRCGFPGNTPGNTLLEEYVRRGLGQMGLVLIRRSI